jgi:hypothetical protein
MNSKAFLGATLIALTLCLACGGFYAAYSVKQTKFDSETLCPSEGAKAVTVIIVDKTDPLTPSEQRETQSLIENARDQARPGDRIVVKLLEQRQNTGEVVLDTLVDLCNPGAEANPIFQNPVRMARRYQNAFMEPIGTALAKVSAQGSAPTSPIAHALESALREFNPMHHVPLKLVLISDLMEHGQEASAYNGTLSEAALRRMLMPGLERALEGASITILLLSRTRHTGLQAKAVSAWVKLFKDASGHEPAILRP